MTQNLDRFKFKVYISSHHPFIKEGVYTIISFCNKTVKLKISKEMFKIPIEYCFFIQSTGLKDKNGKLLYENDIIEFISGFRFEVIFNTSIREMPYGFILKAIKEEGIYHTRLHPKDEGGFEVIGNIYENPRLLSNEII